MIQRIQTVFLLLVVVLMGATAFCPLVEIVNGTPQLSTAFHSYGIGVDFPTWGVLIFAMQADYWHSSIFFFIRKESCR